jgi:hypothetical protein
MVVSFIPSQFCTEFDIVMFGALYLLPSHRRFGDEYKAAKHTLEQYQKDVDQFRKVLAGVCDFVWTAYTRGRDASCTIRS